MKFRTITAAFLIVLLLTSFVVIFAGWDIADAQESNSPGLEAASGANRFIVWEDGKNENLDIFFKRSPDNGATWQAAKNLSNNPGLSINPEVAVSGPNVYVVWLQRDSSGTLEDIFLRRSTDNGSTWKPIVKITSIGTVGLSTPQVLASGSNVYVVWEQENGEIYFRRSVDNGATWKAIFNLSNNPGVSQVEKIALSGNKVYVVWLQWDADQTQSDIFFRRSTDNGVTWKPKVNLSGSGNAFSPELTPSGSHIHVVWTQPDTVLGINDYQIFIRSSADGGATWKPSKDLTAEEVQYDFSRPLVAVSGNNVYVLYEEVVEGCCDYTTDIFFLVSHDNGATWEAPETIATRVIQNEGSPPLLLGAGSNVYAVWVVADYGAYGDLFFRKSTDNGETWGAVSADLNNKTRGPRELRGAVSGSSLYLVWSNIFPKEVYFLRSIDTGTTWKTVLNISNNTGPSAGPAFGK